MVIDYPCPVCKAAPGDICRIDHLRMTPRQHGLLVDGNFHRARVRRADVKVRLSPTQQAVADELKNRGTGLVRVNGGFWTTADRAPDEQARAGAGHGRFDFWVTVGTVRALEKLGVLERINEYPQEWRDTRQLTEAWR